MNEFKEAIKREQNRILRLADLVGPQENDKRGVLVLDRRGNSTYCYEKNGTSKKYLGKTDSNAAREYVKSRFLAEKRLRLMADQDLLADLSQRYQDYSFDAVMEALPGSYRKIIREDFNNERYEELKRWANADYSKNEVPFPDAEIYTADGRRVRSKGECLHGNILISKGIPFRYDSLIRITDKNGNSRAVSPDFLIQNFNHSLTGIEHLGRLFDKRYAIDFGEKCYWYMQAGFVLGKNFFITSDDIHGGTDTQTVWEVAEAVERLFYAE